jgi:hypothetical protein
LTQLPKARIVLHRPKMLVHQAVPEVAKMGRLGLTAVKTSGMWTPVLTISSC